MKNFEYIGYLIEKNNIDEIKKKIKYTELRPLFEKEETYDKFKQKIKDIDIKEIVPKKFNNSDEIKKELTNKKSFYLIKQDYLTKKSPMFFEKRSNLQKTHKRSKKKSKTHKITQISNPIRKKLKLVKSKIKLKAIRNMGYVLEVDDEKIKS